MVDEADFHDEDNNERLIQPYADSSLPGKNKPKSKPHTPPPLPSIEDDFRVEQLRCIVEQYNSTECQGQTVYAYLGGRLCVGLKDMVGHGEWQDFAKGFVQTEINDVLKEKHQVSGTTEFVQVQTLARWMRIYKNWDKIATAARDAGYKHVPTVLEMERGKKPPVCDFGAVTALALIAKPKVKKKQELTKAQESFLRVATSVYRKQLKAGLLATKAESEDQMKDVKDAVRLGLWQERHILDATNPTTGEQDRKLIQSVIAKAFARWLGKKRGETFSVKVE